MSTPEGAPVFYTIEEAAEILRLDTTRQLVRNMARLPHVQIGGSRVFTAEHIAQIALGTFVGGGNADLARLAVEQVGGESHGRSP